jgi:alanine transaminase
MVNPNQLNSTATSDDAKKRAKWYIDNIISAGSYTHSFGIPLVRESVTKYIEKSDEVPKPSVNDIILTEGASQGVHILVSMLITKPTDGIMIPIPQYPLYSASISLNGGQVVAYYLDEESGWQLQEE